MKDLQTISYILSTSTLILEEYKRVGTDDFSKTELLRYFDAEDSLYEALNLSPGLVAEIVTMVNDKLGVPLDSPLPNGLSPFMTEKTYPYIRLLARSKYLYKEKQFAIDDFATARFQDLEIGLFHKSLTKDGIANPEVQDKLTRYSWIVLIDSPKMERAIVQNDMQPLEYIDDSFDFCLNLWSTYQVKKSLNKIGIPDEKSGIRKRRARFDVLFNEMYHLANRYANLCQKGRDNFAEMVMCVSYLKAIIASLPEIERQKIYAQLEKREDSIMESTDLNTQINDIEEVLSPSIRKIDFVDREKIV